MNSPTDVQADYEKYGWASMPDRLDADSARKLAASIDVLAGQERPEVVREKDSDVVRALHGCNRYDSVCARLVRLPMFVRLAESVLDGPVYVYQFKVNMKQSRTGEAWPWHQDFAFWHLEDGMPSAHAVNFAILLDDVTEDNGPLEVIPETHRLGLVGLRTRHGESGDWRDHVSADLSHTVEQGCVDSLIEQYGKTPLVGTSGSTFLFHPSIVHASGKNTSGQRRAMVLITYNAVDNAPAEPLRPEFLVGRDRTPLTPVADNAL